MRGMILAAGRGKRMGSLTANVPKPLLRLRNHYLIEYSIYALAEAGIHDIVINVCYRGDQIKQALGDGSRYGVRIQYSVEDEALETGGGVYQALPLLGPDPFVVLSCDVVTDYPLQRLPVEPKGLAHLVLVDNPIFHPKGDFSLEQDKIYCGKGKTFTFGNIGVYRPELFADCKPGKFLLGTLLKETILKDQVSGEYFKGIWYNLGSPHELSSVTLLPEIQQKNPV